MTRHARTSEDLLLTRINNNPSFSQANFSSLLTRRELVDQLGRMGHRQPRCRRRVPRPRGEADRAAGGDRGHRAASRSPAPTAHR